jgi:hypothetical protein
VINKTGITSKVKCNPAKKLINTAPHQLLINYFDNSNPVGYEHLNHGNQPEVCYIEIVGLFYFESFMLATTIWDGNIVLFLQRIERLLFLQEQHEL